MTRISDVRKWADAMGYGAWQNPRVGHVNQWMTPRRDSPTGPGAEVSLANDILYVRLVKPRNLDCNPFSSRPAAGPVSNTTQMHDGVICAVLDSALNFRGQ